MIQEIGVQNANGRLYNAFKALYSSSFPVFEQRTEAQQAWAFGQAEYHLAGYTDEEKWIGFISYWEFDTYIYIEHFAIDATLRGQGYGSRVLKAFVEKKDKTVLLEIDPIVDEVSAARLRFYTHCGFQTTPYTHRHPAYREGFPPHPLVVLTAPVAISEEEYRRFYSDLCEVVMRNTPPPLF